MTTIFTKIIQREIPAKIAYETDRVIAIWDISPQAPVHILIIPKKPIAKFHDLEEDDASLLQEMFQVAKIVADQEKVAKGYRLVINNGKEGGQEVFHLHIHLLGGRQLSGKLG